MCPEALTTGLTWQQLTKLLQLCNSVAKKRKGLGITFNGPRKKMNQVRETICGKYPWKLAPGVYLCGVAMAVAGHMFVLEVQNTGSIVVHDSNNSSPQPYEEADMDFVTRWIFVLRCSRGFF